MVRIKNRYLLVHILSPDLDSSAFKSKDEEVPAIVEFHRPSPDTLQPQLLARLIKEQVSLQYGDYGLGLVSGSLKIIYLSSATSTAIVRVARDHYRLVWSALSFITELPNGGKAPRACVMKVVRVSGTIKKAEEAAIREARMAILKAKGKSWVDELTALLGNAGDEDAGRDVVMGMDDSDEGEEDMESEGD